MGYSLGVCSRCAGIYIGFLSGVLIYPILRGFKVVSFPSRWILVASILPLFFTVLLSRLNMYQASLFIRSLTGFIPGVIFVFFVLPTVFDVIQNNPRK